MSKFFVQMLFSVMIGVGAALGLSPDARSDLREILQDAKAYLHERVNVVIENTHDLSAGMDAAISAKASADNGKNVDAKVNSTLNVKSGNESSLFDNWFPSLSMDGILSNKMQTDIETDGSNVDVELKEKLKSTLGLEAK